MPAINASNSGEGVAIAVLFVGIVLLLTLRYLQRGRRDLAIGQALVAAFVLRMLAVLAINATGMGASLRGGDESTFLYYAQFLASQPLGHGDLPHGIYQLQTVLFGLQLKLGFMNVTALRVTQIGIAMLGTLFMIAAAYDLAGAKAARYAAWVLALEPSSMFFNSEIHKESLMELAAGLAALGGVWFWKRLDVRGLFICGIGCLIGIETRGYAGWFLVCGCVVMVLHASLRGLRSTSRTLPFVYAIIVAAMIVGPTVLAATGGKNLKLLQQSQSANATGAGEGGSGQGNGSNLALEQVNLSSRGAIITSLPTKMKDLVLEPYPWQLHDTSQMFGAIGTLFAYVIIAALIRYGWLSRGRVFERAGPLLYPLLFEMIAYSLTVGNAGTGFRYRSHLITLGIVAMATLRQLVREERRTADNAELMSTATPPAQAMVPAAV